MNYLKYRLASLSVFVSITAPCIASSHSAISKIMGFSSIEARLTQLERISNAYSQLFIQIQQQISENQSDIDSLRGQIQENQHQLNQVTENQRRISLQINEIRERNVNLKSSLERNYNDSILLIPDKIRATTGKMIQNRDFSREDASARDYNIALILMRDKSHYGESIIAFQNFIRKHPNSIYQPNAKYWLGQLNYRNGRKNNAICYFSSVVKNYPKSSKASSAMYKIGLIIYNRGDVKEAKEIFQQIEKKYPGTDSARQARKHLNSM